LPGEAAPGLIAFNVPGACELRAFDLRSGRAIALPRLATTCELSAPRVGTHVAYSVGEAGGVRRTFRLFDLRLGHRPKRLHYCPRAYDPHGATAFVNSRLQILVGGRPLLTAPRPVWDLAWGVDGSLAVVIVGDAWRVDRYKGRRLVGAARLPRSTAANFTMQANLAPDNCAALVAGAAVIRLVDLGCFRGPAPRTFRGVFADWSPDGTWIAVVEPDAVVFHRVVGREGMVRWNVAAGQLAWLGG
jgi:hypothetical protein